MPFNMPPGFETRKDDREYFKDAEPEMYEQEDIPTPDPEEWREKPKENERYNDHDCWDPVADLPCRPCYRSGFAKPNQHDCGSTLRRS